MTSFNLCRSSPVVCDVCVRMQESGNEEETMEVEKPAVVWSSPSATNLRKAAETFRQKYGEKIESDPDDDKEEEEEEEVVEGGEPRLLKLLLLLRTQHLTMTIRKPLHA